MFIKFKCKKDTFKVLTDEFCIVNGINYLNFNCQRDKGITIIIVIYTFYFHFYLFQNICPEKRKKQTKQQQQQQQQQQKTTFLSLYQEPRVSDFFSTKKNITVI